MRRRRRRPLRGAAVRRRIVRRLHRAGRARTRRGRGGDVDGDPSRARPRRPRAGRCPLHAGSTRRPTRSPPLHRGRASRHAGAARLHRGAERRLRRSRIGDGNRHRRVHGAAPLRPQQERLSRSSAADQLARAPAQVHRRVAGRASGSGSDRERRLGPRSQGAARRGRTCTAARRPPRPRSPRQPAARTRAPASTSRAASHRARRPSAARRPRTAHTRQGNQPRCR